jgi:hypothetical protein
LHYAADGDEKTRSKVEVMAYPSKCTLIYPPSLFHPYLKTVITALLQGLAAEKKSGGLECL